MENLLVLNNEGVAAALYNDFEQAFELFGEAKRFLRDELEKLNLADSTSESSPSTIRLEVEDLGNADAWLHSTCAPGPAFFDKMFYLDNPGSDGKNSSMNFSNCVSVAIAVLYNEATAHHHIYTKTSRSIHWRIAMGLYRECRNFSNFIDKDKADIPVETFGLLFLALFNNASHLLALVFDREKVDAVMKQLETFVVALGNVIDPACLDFFESNIQIWKAAKPFCAASA